MQLFTSELMKIKVCHYCNRYQKCNGVMDVDVSLQLEQKIRT